MAFSGIKLDPEDPFDRIVFTEQTLLQNGYDAGFTNGKEAGEIDGYRTGLVQGKELSREIGFYKGFVSMLLALITCDIDSKHKEKQFRLLEQLNTLLGEYVYDEKEFDNMQLKLGQIRSKFKQISSVFKLPTNNIKHNNEMSF